MKKENHNEEIRATRVGGFGGSDAAMVVAIADNIKHGRELTTTQKRRLRVVMGLEEPRPDFTTPEIEEGRRFEDEVASSDEITGDRLYKWEREVFITTPEMQPVNFRVFAHADLCDVSTMSVKEVKWSGVLDFQALRERYRWQLQWYYMLGVTSVSLVFRDCDGDTGSLDIPKSDKDVAALVDAWRTIDERWKVIDTDITEYGEEDIAPSVMAAIRTLQRLTVEKKRIEADIEAVKEELAEAFRVNGAVKFYGDFGSVSMVEASESLQLDTRKLAADYPDIVASYRTKLVRKPAYIVTKFRD